MTWTSPSDFKLKQRVKDITEPPARAGHTSNLVGRKLIIYGGGDGKLLNDMYYLNVDTLQWFSVESGNVPERTCHTCDNVGSQLVVFGGANGIKTFNDLYLVTIGKHKLRRVRSQSGTKTDLPLPPLPPKVYTPNTIPNNNNTLAPTIIGKSPTQILQKNPSSNMLNPVSNAISSSSNSVATGYGHKVNPEAHSAQKQQLDSVLLQQYQQKRLLMQQSTNPSAKLNSSQNVQNSAFNVGRFKPPNSSSNSMPSPPILHIQQRPSSAPHNVNQQNFVHLGSSSSLMKTDISESSSISEVLQKSDVNLDASILKNCIRKTSSAELLDEKCDVDESAVVTWLCSIGMNKYIPAFVKEDIGLDILPELDDVHLKFLGINSLRDRLYIIAHTKKIGKCVKEGKNEYQIANLLDDLQLSTEALTLETTKLKEKLKNYL
eukprot:TRINITY_DN942_c0_g1_i2.p1 TRINITY_DN942_c0_g1~~TRINITY_DN942_c0_g1_i2.p1  ORF type:complete len:432 (+),score=66.89 TRINITY_DN942_c0_g1_i2:49-1344(+)